MLTRKPMHVLNVTLFLLLILVLLVQSAAARPVGQGDEPPGNPGIAPVSPDAPSSIMFSYQGNLLDSNGNPISNPAMPMTFKLYTMVTGGTACWTEDRTGANAVNVQTGHFQVLLGRVTTMNTACLTGDAYLELIVNGETLTPREQLASVAFAVEAQTVSNGAVTTIKIADGAVTTIKIADGAVTTAKIQDGQVSSADITDNTVDESDIADSFKARDADKLDNLDSSAFAPATHNHDAFYYTKGESDSRFFNVSGDTVTGNLTVDGNAAIGPPNSGEGGEITLRAGDSGNSWTVDNNRGQFRLHHDGLVYFTVSPAGDVKSQSDLTAGHFLRLQGTDFIMEEYGDAAVVEPW
ncbi:MAG: hypothetical protein IPM84_17085 [Anaerolineae bacterium]|nr:hypothetical protein [Anaerolineae bacterium]